MNNGMKIQMIGCRIIQIKNCLYKCKTAQINILKNIGIFQHWNIGKFQYCEIGTFQHWEIGTLGYLENQTNINRYNLLNIGLYVKLNININIFFIFFDLPGTLNAAGVIKTLACMDYVFVPDKH